MPTYTMHLPCKIFEAHIYFSPCARVHGLTIPLVHLPQQKPEKQKKTSRVNILNSEGEKAYLIVYR